MYNVISKSGTAAFNNVLARNDVLGEHPRQDPASLQAVRRMKPFWSLGEDSYHWMDKEFLQSYTKSVAT
jgi:hypothetical protein